MQKIHHPSPIQTPIIQLLGDSPNFSVLPGQGAQGFQLFWLAEGLGSVSAFISMSCSLAMGSGSSVCYSFKCPTGREEGAFGRDRGAPPRITVPPPHPGVVVTFAVRGACVSFHLTVEAHLCDGEFWENTEGSGR